MGMEIAAILHYGPYNSLEPGGDNGRIFHCYVMDRCRPTHFIWVSLNTEARWHRAVNIPYLSCQRMEKLPCGRPWPMMECLPNTEGSCAFTQKHIVVTLMQKVIYYSQQRSLSTKTYSVQLTAYPYFFQ